MTAIITRKNDSPGLLDLLPVMPQGRQTWHCFEGPEGLAAYLRGTAKSAHWDDAAWTSSNSFAGEASYEGALDMAAQGWQEGAERVARLRDKIAVALPMKRKLDQFHVAGALVDVPRYLAGNPQCMKRPVPRVNRARPILTLVSNMTGNAYVGKEVFVNRCAAVAAVVDAIEANGYSCHVIGVDMSAQGGYLFGTALTVKEPGDVPDVARLAFSLGHIAMFRRLGFAMRSSDRAHKPLGTGYGYTMDFPLGTVPNLFIVPSVGSMAAVFRTEQDSIERGLPAIIEALRAQDCPAFPREEVAT